MTSSLLATGLLLDITSSSASKSFIYDELLAKQMAWGESMEDYQYNVFGRSGFGGYTTLINAQKMVESVSDDNVNAYDGLAHFIKAYKIFYMSMEMGDLPYEEALDGISNTQTINPGALGNTHEERVKNLVQVMDGYFDQGAHHLNVNVFGKEKLIDAMEHPEKEIFSVQWHPEAMAANDDEQMLKLFRHHVESSRLFKEAKRIHHRNVTLDSHTDTPMIFPGEFNIGLKEGGKVNLPFMEEGLIDATIMVAYIPQGPRDDASLLKATDFAMNRLQEIHRQMELNRSRMCIAYTPQEVHVLKAAGKKAIMLGVENGYAIGKDIENITRFRKMGVSYITLCHNGSNDICDSARGDAEWNGLSPFGKEVVRKMNETGVLVDISHAAESTFYDALETSTYPIIASHSSARALCNHPRNLTDEQLKALAEQGGVAQICLYKGFINEDAEKASLSDAIRHIDHIVDLIGIDHVGIGSDFDGDGELIGCRASNELINITMRLLKEGYTENDIAKIWGGNLLRVMNKAQSAPDNSL